MTKGVSLTIAAGLLILTYLLYESQGPDQARVTRVQEALQSLQLHEAALNRDVLLARAGLLAHYDSLPITSGQIGDDLRTLRTEGRALEGIAGPIDDAVASLDSALTDKLTLVEYLKSENALLRNSMAYFAQSMRVLASRRNPGASAIDVAALAEIMVRFPQTPKPEVSEEAEAALARVSRLAERRSDLKPIAAHARLILDSLPRLDRLLAAIIESPTTMRAEALQTAILEHTARADARAQRFRLVLYFAALVLLGYVVYQVARLRARARELRRQEMQLIQANKMTSLGMLVSSVAHEVNNPNQLVLMNSSVLAEAWDDVVRVLDLCRQAGRDFTVAGLPYTEMRETVPPLIRQMRDGARRIEGIIADLKGFARPGAHVSERFQLNDVLNHAVRLLKHVVQKRTDHFQMRLAPDLPFMQGDPQQVEQVVVNLVINALEALPDRTRAVTVTTSYDAQTNEVALEVRDEGGGISREHLSRLGEPFFTTKAESGGTGLGLPIASSLVRVHNGRLRFVSEPGQGTRAIAEFPAATPGSRSSPVEAQGSIA